MKTILTIALLALSLTTHAATLASTRTAVNNWLTNNWPAVSSKQAAYLTNHGRYWQGLLTCTSTNGIPNFTTAADGSGVMDNLASKPYYQSESISDIFAGFVGIGLPCAFLCDQYDGPLGLGYVVTVFVRFNGTIYTRSHNTGPETWREADWAVWNPGTL